MFTNDSSNRGTLLNSCAPEARSRDSVGERHRDIKIARGWGCTNKRCRLATLGGCFAEVGEGETGDGVAAGARISDLTISIGFSIGVSIGVSIGACCFIGCLKNIHHPAPSKISAAELAANRVTLQRRRGFRGRERAAFKSSAKDGALCSSSRLSC